MWLRGEGRGSKQDRLAPYHCCKRPSLLTRALGTLVPPLSTQRQA